MKKEDPTSRNIPKQPKPKDPMVRKNLNTNLNVHSNMRIQTLPDTTALDLEIPAKGSLQQNKKSGGMDKKPYNFSKETDEVNVAETQQMSIPESKVNKHFSDFVNRKEKETTKEDRKKTPERDLSSHSAKSSYSVNLMRKVAGKNQNGVEKAANYTIHITKEKSGREEQLTLNERFLNCVKNEEYEKCLEILEKNKGGKLLNINYRGENDWSSIHYAVLNGNHKILKLLLYNDAIIDSETSSKLTPLMMACQK